MDRTRLVGIAGELFQNHGLDVRGWRLEFKPLGHRIGWCCSRRLVIVINDYYADHNDQMLVMDTLLHEAAHAIVGPVHQHNGIWKEMALRLGCAPTACSKIDVVLRPGKWRASCPSCALQFEKYRRPKYIAGYYCPKCGKDKGKLVFIAQVSEVA